MYRFILSLLLLTLLATCTGYSRPNFERMTAEELHAYNSSVEYPDRVYCERTNNTGSYIKRVSCMTYRERLGGGIGTLNSASSSSRIINTRNAINN